jgi:hypothetical protein
MSNTLKRSLEVDFFRGIAMIVIVIDHISGSTLSRFTLHNYAFCDAAEVFVFLGGYASAAAFTAIAARRSRAAATRRLLRRAWEIYRAYLLTAALMLLIGGAMLLFHLDTPTRTYTEAPQLSAQPFTVIFNILTWQRQPYLSSVLPMYVLFALTAPLTVPLVQQNPLAAAAGSVALWFAAPVLGHWLPSVYADGWPFNPFAWQLMFVGGMFCRLRPLSNDFQTSPAGVWITRGALAVVLVFAFCKLFLETQPPAGILKQNLAPMRVISFWAIAWLFAQGVRMGRIKPLAQAMPWLVTVGQQGLPCFITGSAVSLIADTVLRAVTPHSGVMLGLAADVCAAGSMLLAAHWARRLKARAAAQRQAGAGAASPVRRNALRAFVELVQRSR